MLIIAVAFCLAFCPLPCSARPAQRGDSAVKLTQTHVYWGDMETIVSGKGLRINNRGRMKYCLVSRSPDWKVTVFRDDDKTCITQSLKQFLSTGMISEFVLKQQVRTIGQGVPERNIKINGTVVKHLQEDRTEYQYLPLARGTEAPIEALLHEIYKLPTNGGIPIRYVRMLRGVDWMTGLDTAGSEKVSLCTKKIEHIIVSKQLFEPPTGYKPLKSMQEVLMSKVSRDASGDFDVMFETGKSSKNAR